ncbi:hypothetical protein EOM81_09930 [bacterium]|nr:hypothetical protein [bacterium]
MRIIREFEKMGLISREYGRQTICFSEKACLYIHGLFKWSNNNSRNIYCQLLYDVKWRVNTGNPKLIPLHSTWLKNQNAHTDFVELTKLGLVTNDGKYFHGKNGGKCLYYTIPEHIIKEFDRLNKLGGKRVSIFTLKPYKHNRTPSPIMTESVWTESKHRKPYISSLQEAAVKEIMNEPITVNLGEFKRLLQHYEELLIAGQISASDKKYLPEMRALDHFLSYGYNPSKTGDFQTFTPKFKFCYTGRVIELIGLQLLRADVRRALLKNVRHANFDIKKSQLNVLNYYLIKNGFTQESKAIEAMISNSGELTSLINDGYPEDLLKDAIYNTIFACGFGHNLKTMPKLRATLQLLGLDYNRAVDFLRTIGKVADKLARHLFKKALVSLKNEQRVLGDYQDNKLTSDELETRAKKKYKQYLRGYYKEVKKCKESGKPAPKKIDELASKTASKKRMVLALTLQGLESYIIHTITLRGKDYGYRVISNQHDGCIVVGDTDKVQAVMQDINNALGYVFCLKEKPV